MERYLNGIGPFIVGNLFAQSAIQYPYQQVVFVRLVMIGKDGQSPWDIRDRFRQGRLTFDEALNNLRGFYTNYRPWTNLKAWMRYLVRTYKRRWNIETGFAMLNKVHETGRERLFTGKLATLFLRGFIYNCWQSWRMNRIRNQFHHRDYTLSEYKIAFAHDLECVLMRSCQNKI